MLWLKEWLQQLVVLLMIAAFFDLITAHHATHRYVRLVVSLCILLSLLSPLAKFVKTDLNQWLQSDSLQAAAFAPHSSKATSKSDANQTALQEVYENQTLAMMESKLAAELSQYVKTVEPEFSHCELDMVSDGKEMRIKQIDCHAQTTQIEARVRQPITFSPVVISLNKSDIVNHEAEQSNAARSTAARSTADPLETSIRSYVSAHWALEIEQMNLHRAREVSRQ